MKTKLYLIPLLAAFVACQPTYEVEDAFVATFEEASIAPDSLESFAVLPASGTFESGNFVLQQEVQDYGEYGVYYFGNVVSNQTDNTYAYHTDAYKSAAGGAYQGKNYIVWTGSYEGYDKISLKTPAVIPGMYVCNTTWVVDAIKNGDSMVPEPFTDNDYFLLTIKGLHNGTSVGTVEFYLAQGKNYVAEWTYVNLTSLGEVDEISFALSGGKSNDYGMSTPAYFCIDNLGSK